MSNLIQFIYFIYLFFDFEILVNKLFKIKLRKIVNAKQCFIKKYLVKIFSS
jgi:hypothetical protein